MRKLTPHIATRVEKLTTWIGSLQSLFVHTVLFILAFTAGVLGFATWELVLLVLTTVVSLEAIYLAIFIQMTVNRNTQSLIEMEEDVEEIQEDVAHIEDEMDEIQEDVEDIQEDLEEINEDEDEDEVRKKNQSQTLERITKDLERLLVDIETLKKNGQQ